jgi:protoporphyrin/coproporphyrin ferrochelatase
MKHLTAVLLINLGTPKSPRESDVHRYLIEFLTDKRVLEMSWLKRQLLVRAIIIPKRVRQSAQCYSKIWLADGSPLMVYGRVVQQKLQAALGPQCIVELAMRYQEPSIKKVLKSLMEQPIEHLIVIPLFPQYASATTGSVLEKVQLELSRFQSIPKVTLINQFAQDPNFIEAIVASAQPLQPHSYDHILFSFHGLPIRQQTQPRYTAQCFETVQVLVNRLQLPLEKYTVCFQSRLGKEPWLQPYTSEVLKNLAKNGMKKVLVFCPSFVSDCLETIYEIGVEYQSEFVHAGGERLDYVPGLNDHPKWIESLKNIVLKESHG